MKKPLDILKGENAIRVQEFDRFYQEVKPNVFHIHTLMGLSLEFVKSMKITGAISKQTFYRTKIFLISTYITTLT